MNKDNGMHLLCCFIYSQVVPQHLPVVEKFQEVNYSKGCAPIKTLSPAVSHIIHSYPLPLLSNKSI